MSRTKSEQRTISLLTTVGYSNVRKITDTLQGTIWKASKQRTKQEVVIKVTNRNLHSHSTAIYNGIAHAVSENILTENRILKSLTADKMCPSSIIKHVDFFKSNLNYFLVMEHGGISLFDFVVSAHNFISKGLLSIDNWHKVVKIIFKQMVDSVQYIHSKNTIHHDLSLENLLINDVEIETNVDSKQFRFVCESVQIKLIDFGLSEIYHAHSDFSTSKYCGKRNYCSPEITNRKDTFNAKANDVFCLVSCLFMMIIGKSWSCTHESDEGFMTLMKSNGDVSVLLRAWNRMDYVNQDLIDVFKCGFQYEDNRSNLSDIQQTKWLQS